MNLNEAAARLKTSERTIRRRIEEGHIKAEKVRGKWVIEDLGEEELYVGDPIQALVAQLKTENEYLRKENEELRQELHESRSRADTIILRLTDQRKLIEARQPFWKRWRRQKAADDERERQIGVI